MPYKDPEKRRASEQRYYAKMKKENGTRIKKYRAKRLIRVKRRWAGLTIEQRREEIARRRPRTALERRREHIKGRYGLTLEQWAAMFEAQGQCCAICKASTSGWKRGWHTDHDHKTKKVRAILCHLCNRTLGQLKDDVTRFQAFIDYLEART